MIEVEKYIEDLKVDHDLLEVSLFLPFIEEKGKKIRITTFEVSEYLIQKGYSIGNCIRSQVLTNLNKDRQKGSWVFSLNLTTNVSEDIIQESFRTKKTSNRKNVSSNSGSKSDPNKPSE